MTWRRRLQGLASLLLAGCSSVQHTGPGNVLIPNQALNLSKALVLPLESLVAGALIYRAVDPLAPNWRVGQQRLDARHYELTLSMKTLSAGGQGEAREVFVRHARALAREAGNGQFEIAEFTESIESTLPFARRVARGRIRIAME